MSNQIQRDLALLGELTNELKELDSRLVSMCDTPQRAYRLCMDSAKVRRSQDDWAALVGMNRSQFKQAVSDTLKQRKHMPAEAEEELQLAAGNLAVSQWRDLYRKRLLNYQRSKESRRAELLAELQALEAGE